MPGRTMRGGLAQDPVEAWHKFAFERPAVIFAKTVDQSQEIATALGPRAAHVDGETPKADRDRMLERFARGEIDVLTNVFVLTEGWDCPRAKVCILARGQGSIGPYIQMVGRVMRPHNGERALLIDLPGAMQKHGKPDEIRDFTLDGIKPPAKSGREWLSQCEVCGTTVPGRSRGEVCPECGVPWPEIKPIAIAGVELVRYQEAPMSEKRSEFARLSRIAAERGYRDGWVAHRYRAKFGVWPRGVRA
jgi:superfamily II DNA or RNA helicase